jgi:hypothetical protein
MSIFQFSIKFLLHGHKGDTIRGNTSSSVSNSLFDPNCIFAIHKSDMRLNQTKVELNLWKNGNFALLSKTMASGLFTL